jgi:hypothetical protein
MTGITAELNLEKAIELDWRKFVLAYKMAYRSTVYGMVTFRP